LARNAAIRVSRQDCLGQGRQYQVAMKRMHKTNKNSFIKKPTF
jgi:hypothetical protein